MTRARMSAPNRPPRARAKRTTPSCPSLSPRDGRRASPSRARCGASRASPCGRARARRWSASPRCSRAFRPHQLGATPEARNRRILDVLSAQTRAAGSQGAKLVVWPEAALRADPQRVALVSPYIDARATAASFVSNARFDTFDAHAVSRWTQWYAAGAEPVAGERAPVPLNHPRISPALADPGGLPPLAIHVGDAEVLLDDARTYAARATAAGVDVTLRVWPDMIHAFPTFGEGFES